MHLTRSSRRLGTALIAAALLLGSGTAAVAKDGGDDGKAGDRAERALEQARQHRRHRPAAAAQLKGTVATLAASGTTFEIQVTDGNQPTLRGTKVTVKLAPEAYLTLNDRKTTLAGVKVGDAAKVTGLLDAATGPITAYLVRFGRTAPTPTQAKGPVAAVTATGVTLTVGGQPLVLQLATPSIITLNGQPATLADVHVGDKGEATAVGGVAYVLRITRTLPPTPSAVRLDGTVTSLSPLTLLVKGVSRPGQLATPSVVTLDDAAATIADIHVNDECVAVGIPTATIPSFFHLACRRS